MLNFLYDRLRGQLRERGFSQNEVEAVVAQNPDNEQYRRGAYKRTKLRSLTRIRFLGGSE